MIERSKPATRPTRDTRLPPRTIKCGGGKAEGRRAKRVQRMGVGPHAH